MQPCRYLNFRRRRFWWLHCFSFLFDKFWYYLIITFSSKIVFWRPLLCAVSGRLSSTTLWQWFHPQPETPNTCPPSPLLAATAAQQSSVVMLHKFGLALTPEHTGDLNCTSPLGHINYTSLLPSPLSSRVSVTLYSHRIPLSAAPNRAPSLLANTLWTTT